MISYPIYKVVHYLGIFVTVTAIAAFLARTGRATPSGERPDVWLRRSVIAHGTGLFLVLLGGFGMLARLEVTSGLGLPGWIWAKLVIWGAIGVTVTVARRRPGSNGLLIVVVPLLAVLAGSIALLKPF